MFSVVYIQRPTRVVVVVLLQMLTSSMEPFLFAKRLA